MPPPPAPEPVLETAAHGSTAVAHLAEPRSDAGLVRTLRPRPNTLAEQALATATLAALFTWVWLGPWITLAAAVGALHGRPLAAAVLAAILTLWFWPLPEDGRALWPAFKSSRVWDAWRRYFSMVLVTPPLPPDGAPPFAPGEPAIFAHFPHGTYPIGSFLSMGLTGPPASGLPPPDTVAATGSILLHLPVLRQINLWCGCVPAGRASVEAALGAGRCVGVVPEGVAGIFTRSDGRHERVLTAHKGFVKLALRHSDGSGRRPPPILPVFVFNQSRVFSFAGSARLSRRLRMSVGVWWGRWGLPCLPRPVHLVMAVGRPVRLAAPATPGRPTQAEIDAGFDAVWAELARTFEAVKPGVSGYEDTRLVAV